MKTLIRLLLTSAVLINIICSIGCTKLFNRSAGPEKFYHTRDTSIIVMKSPGATDEAFRIWLKQMMETNQPITIKAVCPCDSTLLELDGTGVIKMQEQLASGGSSTAKPKKGGKDGPAIWCVNFHIALNDSTYKADTGALVSLPNNMPSDIATVVAVLDTGVDTAKADRSEFHKRLTGSLYKSGLSSCVADNGWNFVKDNDDWRDDERGKHGTTVSRFIIDQAYNAPGGLGNVKILPVKVLDARGEGSLFKLLCGMAYAKKQGAKIINASLGFYAPKTTLDGEPDSSGYLLQTFIENNLTPAHIVLVCAAGNDDPTINWDDSRDLDVVNFYPASFSASLQNVIAVTTVNDSRVDNFQNYSNNIVDIGVRGDNDFVFVDPLSVISDRSIQTKRGSSFAAPIVSGKLCAYYSIVKDAAGNFPGKVAIWNKLSTPTSGIILSKTIYKSQIKGGLYTTK